MNDAWDDNEEMPGVGRGNGEGSKATRFRPGGPSGNPRGRPRKIKSNDTLDMSAALRRRLDRKVKVWEDGVRREIPRSDAMAEALLQSFQTAQPRDQIRIMMMLTSPAVNAPEIRNGDIPLDAIEEFVRGLAEEVGVA